MSSSKLASEMSATELWGALLGVPDRTDVGAVRRLSHCVLHGYAIGDHSACPANLCPYCAAPVTNAQIEDADAFMIDERGPHDGEFAHKVCAQGAREP